MKEGSDNTVVSFPVKLLTGALAFSGMLLVWLVWSGYEAYLKVETAQRRDLRIEEWRGTIVHLDEVLTMSARMAAATGDLSWEQRYRHFEPQLDAAVKEAIQLTSESGSAEAAAQTDSANFKLVEMENQSFSFVRARRIEDAKTVLFSEAYETQKKIYAEGMVKFIGQLREQLTASQRQKRREAGLSVVVVAVSILLLFGTWLTVVRRLNLWRTSQLTSFTRLTRAAEELRKAHDLLEKRVEERTGELKKANADLSAEIASREKAQQELEATHRQLLEISRQAGMAEVATSVLHNVGNVLNSVNVSATVFAETLAKSKAANLAKVVGLLREHEADMGTFLMTDPKGKQVPDYLAQLAQHLATERATLLEEMDQLRKYIEHIKDIVAKQQSYAKVSGVTESIKAIELVEDALRFNAGALVRHDVKVVREYDADPTLVVDKHKVLQI